MMRNVLSAGLVFAAAVEPLSGEPDIVRYAITQGGLLAVVLVLLWSYRRDTMSVLKEQEQRLKVMTDLVDKSSTALTRSADASERMARAVENLERAR